KTIAAGGTDSAVRIWDVATGTLQRTLMGARGRSFSLAFSPDGGRLASGATDDHVWVWDVEKGDLLSPRSSFEGDIDELALSPAGRTLAVGMYYDMALVDTTSGAVVKNIIHRTGSAAALRFTPDGTKLFVCGGHGVASAWDMATEARVSSFTVCGEYLEC